MNEPLCHAEPTLPPPHWEPNPIDRGGGNTKKPVIDTQAAVTILCAVHAAQGQFHVQDGMAGNSDWIKRLNWSYIGDFEEQVGDDMVMSMTWKQVCWVLLPDRAGIGGCLVVARALLAAGPETGIRCSALPAPRSEV